MDTENIPPSETTPEETALNASRECFSTLMEYMPIGVQGYDSDGVVFFWNRASEKIYGYTAEEAIGRNLGDLIIPDAIQPLFRKGLALGKTLTKSGEFAPAGEVELKRKDGSTVCIHSIHTIICPEGEPPQFYCIDVDLSDRKKAEETLRSNLEQIEKLNQHMIGREMRMIELKHEVNELLKKLGEKSRYIDL